MSTDLLAAIIEMETAHAHYCAALRQMVPHAPGPREKRNMMTDREIEILTLVAQDLANKEIGLKLHLSEKTVKNHLSRIFDKLNVTARYVRRTSFATFRWTR